MKYEVSLLIKGLSWSLFVLTSCVLDISLSFVQINSNPVAAEATILSLHQSPQPYKACRYILGKSFWWIQNRPSGLGKFHLFDWKCFLLPENSQVANARFQAAAAIRESAIREWSFLATDDKGGLIRYFFLLLCYLGDISLSFQLVERSPSPLSGSNPWC